MSIHPPTHPRFTVSATRHEVMFNDGTAVTLHPVLDCGAPDTFRRALRLPGGTVVIIDLRNIDTALGADLATAPQRDMAGTVYYALRQLFTTRVLFVAQASQVGQIIKQETA